MLARFISADDDKMTTLPPRNCDVVERQLNPPDDFNFISFSKQRFGNATQVKYLNINAESAVASTEQMFKVTACCIVGVGLICIPIHRVNIHMNHIAGIFQDFHFKLHNRC